ncbi:MAG: hypothetical protein HYR76_00705 [Ignavibacteria bacterium]|nr:hypothetical protein [Ignavibacteria bacterium]
MPLLIAIAVFLLAFNLILMAPGFGVFLIVHLRNEWRCSTTDLLLGFFILYVLTLLMLNNSTRAIEQYQQATQLGSASAREILQERGHSW